MLVHLQAMAIEAIHIQAFLSLAQQHPVFDVRSPAEFEHAHIPQAFSLPLFTNEERTIVGTHYKQINKQQAIKTALPFFAQKMVPMIETVENILKTNNNIQSTVLVHCWRGGMRSAGVAWLLNLYGFQVYTLQGGYKAYRQWVLHQFEKKYALRVIGGYTGSGKTKILQHLAQLNYPVIDLEGIAKHKGSAFGGFQTTQQPTQEMFENLLANELYLLQQQNQNQTTIWLEDESQRIGNINLPIHFYEQMRVSPVFFFQIPFEERLNELVETYGNAPKEKIINAIIRIKKRLGGLATKNAINFLLEDNIKDCFAILLQYYDKAYTKGLYNRAHVEQMVTKLDAPSTNASNNTYLLTTLLKTKQND
ncbi:MAG: tRNA 2-selenouridine(34) synthase MnmH [Sphingobacteriales bacterium]|uniref:tRNA 2-selenouridine(34) synthase MnmH n=1 Tax=Hydrotalea flava TaxID=714549 RepID=UPI000A4FAE9A|nr:tRNA 2-selenouridine(34) synthase MnmH [Hydrotalea flava]RTL47986.1 MAG: tRNA 2-selenouridine(34) synthase MnmH [Sphingobacteriales bacterium]